MKYQTTIKKTQLNPIHSAITISHTVFHKNALQKYL